MRGMAAFAMASATMVAACSLGVVDLRLEPAPARLFVSSDLEPDPDDPSSVLITVDAALDPGVGPDRTARRIATELLSVEGVDHEPRDRVDPPRLTWRATDSYPAPGPEGVRLGMPQVAGLGLAESITMRVRVDVTPGDTLLLAEGEDLVLTAEPPSNPAESLDWSLNLTSASLPTYRLELRGGAPWPTEVRVSSGQIPAEALPLQATLRIRWDRALDLVHFTSIERYELVLQSSMEVDWIVQAAG